MGLDKLLYVVYPYAWVLKLKIIIYFSFNMKLWSLRLLIFLILFFALEFLLRIFDFKPGVIKNKFFITAKPVYTGIFDADSNGITFFSGKSMELQKGYNLNRQGFRSDFDFDKSILDSIKRAEKKSTVMLIGDSYTEGCCVTSIENSFADIISSNKRYTMMNFGVGSTDLLQYKLIAQNYVAKLKPDLVVIAFYLGNDIAWRERPIAPGVPNSYTYKDYISLNSSIPFYFPANSKSVLHSPDEAFEHYYNNYTLLGNNRPFVIKLIRKSVILSRIYLGAREKWYQNKWFLNANHNQKEITRKLISEIQLSCSEGKTKLIFVCIPSPSDVIKSCNLKEFYGDYFEGSKCYFPDINIFDSNDYDGKDNSNHFNDSGHKKFSVYLEDVISKQF